MDSNTQILEVKAEEVTPFGATAEHWRPELSADAPASTHPIHTGAQMDIELNPIGHKSRVAVNGADVSNIVRGVTVKAWANELTLITVEVIQPRARPVTIKGLLVETPNDIRAQIDAAIRVANSALQGPSTALFYPPPHEVMRELRERLYRMFGLEDEVSSNG